MVQGIDRYRISHPEPVERPSPRTSLHPVGGLTYAQGLMLRMGKFSGRVQMYDCLLYTSDAADE